MLRTIFRKKDDLKLSNVCCAEERSLLLHTKSANYKVNTTIQEK